MWSAWRRTTRRQQATWKSWRRAYAARPTPVPRAWHDPLMSLERIAWSVTVGICLIGCALLLVSGYQGYGALSAVVGLAAAVNIR